jgi:hypothetical protein
MIMDKLVHRELEETSAFNTLRLITFLTCGTPDKNANAFDIEWKKFQEQLRLSPGGCETGCGVAMRQGS